MKLRNFSVFLFIIVSVSLSFGLDQGRYTQTGEFIQKELNSDGIPIDNGNKKLPSDIDKKPLDTVTSTTPKSKGWFSWFRKNKNKDGATSTTTTTTAKPSTSTSKRSVDTKTDIVAAPNLKPNEPKPSVSSSTTIRAIKQDDKRKEEFPVLPHPKQPSAVVVTSSTSTTTSRTTPFKKEDFPALPNPKQPQPSVVATTPKPNPPNGIPKKDDFPPLPGPKAPQITQSTTPKSKVKDLINYYESKDKNPSGPLPSEILGHSKGNTAGNRISDQELQSLSEELYKKDSNVINYIAINLQAKTYSMSLEDKAPMPLFTIKDKQLWSLPTMSTFVALLDNYEKDVLVNEFVTPQERIEENAFLDAVMNSPVMRRMMSFLKDKDLVSPDPKQQRDLLKQLWFTIYSRKRGKTGSSGFEHVFLSEIKDGELMGFHNWVYYAKQEEENKVNYLGYLGKEELDGKRDVLKPHFTVDGKAKPINSFFAGSSPEFDMAVYTLCFMARADKDCHLKMAGKNVIIKTFTFRYKSSNLIGSAFPK